MFYEVSTITIRLFAHDTLVLSQFIMDNLHMLYEASTRGKPLFAEGTLMFSQLLMNGLNMLFEAVLPAWVNTLLQMVHGCCDSFVWTCRICLVMLVFCENHFRQVMHWFSSVDFLWAIRSFLLGGSSLNWTITIVVLDSWVFLFALLF